MRVTLSVIEGPHQGRVFTFEEHDNFLVGRSKQAHFRLPFKDKFFSRIHFLIEVNPPHCRLLDMNSKNGTHLNGKQVSVADLHDGDRIEAGATILLVSVQREEALSGQTTDTFRPEASPAVRVSSPRTESAPDPTSCLACAAPLSARGTPSSRDTSRQSRSPLCPACREKVRGQPQPITGYQIIEELGRGGMGVVSLALCESDNTLVALKTIIPAVEAGPREVERFLREASILRSLEHPHIVAFRDLGESQGRLYFAMDYVPGTNASRLVKAHGPLPVGRAVGLVCQLLEALEYAHAKGFVHRDIKPANLLVTEEEGREVSKLADFGLARTYQASRLSGLTTTGGTGGTLPFMAPEQITEFRQARPPVDQYAAVATLYYLLTCKYVQDFPTDRQRSLLMILQDEPVPIRSRRPDLPTKLADVIHRGLAAEPGDRFADVKALRQALLGFCR